jgi:hypothetical protein
MLISRKPLAVKLLISLAISLTLLSSCCPPTTDEPIPVVPTVATRTPIPIPLPEPEITSVPNAFPSIQANDLSSESGWTQWCQSMIDLPKGLVANPDVLGYTGVPDHAYIRGQAIIIGSLSAVSATLEKMEVVYKEIVLAAFAIESAEVPDQTISLVSTETTAYTSELKFIQAFNEVAVSSYEASPKRPIAEPNYIIREPDGILDDEGNPGDSGVSGDPSASPLVIGVDPTSFIDQWAFQNIGLAKVEGDRTRGQGVKTIVFDSSPLPTGPYTVWLGPPEDRFSFDGPYPPYSLCVSALIDDYAQSTGSDLQMDSHGLFVANMAHAVAPGSAIHLVQVLQYDEGSGLIRGHLFSLLNSLYIYLEGDRQYRETTGKVDSLTAVNLSLGFDISQTDVDGVSELGGAIESVRVASGSKGDFTVASLEALLSRYQGPGVVFVAAAGNDRERVPQLPASYPEVIGVGGLNYTGHRACFSNSGDVYAPGGGSGGQYTGAGCIFNLETCFQESECLCGVTSVALTDLIAEGDLYSAEYACWAGTSFSAPLVSGMAALALWEGYPSGEIQELFCADPTSTSSNLCGESVTLCNGLQYCQGP